MQSRRWVRAGGAEREAPQLLPQAVSRAHLSSCSPRGRPRAGREPSRCQPRPAQSPLATPVQPWLLSSRLLWCSEGRESACNAGDLGSISGWERCPGGGRDNPLPCPENPVDRGTWGARLSESQSDRTDLTEHTCNGRRVAGRKRNANR